MAAFFPVFKYVNIPNLVTTLALVCGLAGILSASAQKIELGFCFLTAAVFLDKLDGVLARLMKQTSELGGQLDSLTDAVNFCVLPCVLMWVIYPELWILPVLAFYLVCGVWRLAYFNIHGLMENGRCFIGVPTTIVASWFTIFYVLLTVIDVTYTSLLLVSYLLLGSLLMVSAVAYKKNGKLTFVLYLLMPICFAICVKGLIP
jgi:CDP-diacylglycerol--serine O-phosphatidyltransferase